MKRHKSGAILGSLSEGFGIRTRDGSTRFALEDTRHGVYTRDGAFRATDVSDESGWTGVYARDGSLNISIVSGEDPVGAYAPNGSWNVYLDDDPAPPLDPDAEALIARFAVQPDEDRKILIDETIVALKGAGVWDKLEVFYVLAAHDAQAARQNWKAPAFNAVSYNSPSFEVDKGYTGDGSSSYLDSGYIPTTDGLLFEANSNHAGVWVGTDIGSNTMTDFGYPRNSIVSRNTIGAITRNSSNTSDSPILPVETSIGWTCTSRGASIEYAFQKDDYPEVVISRTSAAHDPDDTLMLLCRSAQPTSNTAYSARRLQACHWGSYLTEAERSDLYAILLNYMTTIGAA